MFTKFCHNITLKFSIFVRIFFSFLSIIDQILPTKSAINERQMVDQRMPFIFSLICRVRYKTATELTFPVDLPSPNHFLLSRKIPWSRKIILFLSVSQALERKEENLREGGRGSLERKQPQALPSDGVGTQNFQAPVTNTFVVNILEFE